MAWANGSILLTIKLLKNTTVHTSKKFLPNIYIDQFYTLHVYRQANCHEGNTWKQTNVQVPSCASIILRSLQKCLSFIEPVLTHSNSVYEGASTRKNSAMGQKSLPLCIKRLCAHGICAPPMLSSDATSDDARRTARPTHRPLSAICVRALHRASSDRAPRLRPSAV